MDLGGAFGYKYISIHSHLNSWKPTNNYTINGKTYPSDIAQFDRCTNAVNFIYLKTDQTYYRYDDVKDLKYQMTPVY